ncbi:hypothetical protein HK096_007772 [Nowakowskiella sp. JEL0078]|nr:hypothetical protein HK096_007772 [Nowakowskiella sp. JEL0078]
MGGKSVLAKMVALFALMSQIGSYVPASEVTIGIFTQIITRIGASDNIMHHSSTFHTELIETSDILFSATSQSLVILDELGRGTSSKDGIAIATAVMHWLTETDCFVLFASHCSDLVKEAQKLKWNCSGVAVCIGSDEFDQEEIVFLYRLADGVEKSWGVNVARMAGIKREIIDRANGTTTHIFGYNLNLNEALEKSNEKLKQEDSNKRLRYYISQNSL